MELKKILIIEDDPEERLILSRELKKEGFIVYEAPTGEEGLRIFKEDKPELIIITWDYEDTIKENSKEIKCIPLWKWLLSID